MWWHKRVFSLVAGFAIGFTISGVWHHDFSTMVWALYMVITAWLWREMNIGWNDATATWKFLPFHTSGSTPASVQEKGKE